MIFVVLERDFKIAFRLHVPSEVIHMHVEPPSELPLTAG